MASGKKLTTNEFIDRASDVHNNKFDYSKVVYKNTHTKVIIVCPIHGEFEQKPNDHLRGNGCYACSGKRQTSTTDFIMKAKASIGENYDFSDTEYKNLDTVVNIRCPAHGVFQKSPRLILQQHQGCPACGKERLKLKAHQRTLTQEEFVSKATTVHGNKYSYANSKYTKGNHRLTITCPTHGDFMQRGDNHLRGEGCPTCGKERSKGKGGYTFEYFTNNPEEQSKPAVLYLVDVVNQNEHFIKVGITTKTVDQRFNRSEYKNMTVVPIVSKYTSLYDAFCLEQNILDRFKEFRFFSNTYFSGYTECFRHNSAVMQAITTMINKSEEAT